MVPVNTQARRSPLTPHPTTSRVLAERDAAMQFHSLRAIYFHRDFDGVISAAMLYRLRSNAETALLPVDYDLKDKWAQQTLSRPAAVVDFLYHPEADFWIDHHSNPFLTQEWRDAFRPGPSGIWDPSAPCCPAVIDEAFDLPRDHREHFAGYIEWAAIIDSARYPSPRAATDLSNPYLLLSQVILQLSDPEELATSVRLVAAHTVEEVLRHPSMSGSASGAIARHKTVENEIRELIEFDGVVALLDQSSTDWPYQRYYPYLLCPDARFVVGIYRNGNSLVVSVGMNPWREPSDIHIGRLCQEWGGGGHAQVGGVKAESVSQARGIARSLIVQLREAADRDDEGCEVPSPSRSARSAARVAM